MTAPNYKILAVSHNFNLEGASLSMYELMLGLRDKNYRPYIMSFSSGPLVEHYRREGFDIIDVPFDTEWLKNPKKINDAITQLSLFIMQNEFDFIYANTFLTYPAIHAAANVEKPSIWNIRESQDLNYWREYLGVRLECALAAIVRASAMIYVSKATRELWEERASGHKNWHCITNGFNNDSFQKRFKKKNRSDWRQDHGIDEEAILYLCVGTIHERKGQMDLIQAIAELPPGYDSAAVVCVGDNGGSYSHKIQTYIDSLSKNQRHKISILPRTYNVGDAYNAADVFVCCSRNESYPRIIQEAMSMELPIITTPVFGINEQVIFNETALVYEVGDWKELQRQMINLYSDPDKRRNFGRKGKQHFGSLTSSIQMIDQYADVIKLTRCIN